MFKILSAILLAVSFPAGLLAQDVQADNDEMAELFKADQAARSDLTPEKMSDPNFGQRMWEEDSVRRARVTQLLDEGALNTGNDFYHAAFIFQHGGTPDDYLLAHTLAIAAAGEGHENAVWIAAATLDRYLQAVSHSQIYGTQIRANAAGEEPTMEPYNRETIPDALRELLGAHSLAEQEARLETMREQAGSPPE